MKQIYLSLFLAFSVCTLQAQDGLLDELLESTAEDEAKTDYAYATFKSTRIISGHSVETMAKNNALYIISHRFGPLNTGWRQIFGLDQASIRFGFEYGVTDAFTVGMGRSRDQGTFDFYGKYKLLRQSKGEKKMPFTATAVATLDITSYGPGRIYSTWDNTLADNGELLFIHRISYTYQLMIARKFNDWLSLQITPLMSWQNVVDRRTQDNIHGAIGVGGRAKISKRVAFTAESFIILNDRQAGVNEHTISVGVDIETGGHVFQLHFTNATPMFERGLLTTNPGTWGGRDIRFGFNIVRNFSLNYGSGKKKGGKESAE